MRLYSCLMLWRICSRGTKDSKKKDRTPLVKAKTAGTLGWGGPPLNFISEMHTCLLFCYSVAQHVVNALQVPGCPPTRPTSVTLPALSLDDDSPNGEGSMLRYFLGDEEDDDGETGMHLRLLGEAGLISGSKSMVLFRVVPHAMTLVCQKIKYEGKCVVTNYHG